MCLVEEGETSDEVVSSIHATGNHLCVVAEKLEDSDHGKTSILNLLQLLLSELLRSLALAGGDGDFALTQLKSSPIVDGANKEDDLEPAKGRDGLDGGDTIGDRGEGEARGDVTRKTDYLRHNISDNSKLRNTAVLDLSSSVLVKLGLVDVISQTKRIKVSKRRKRAKLALEAHLQSRASGAHASGRGEGSHAEEGGEDGKGTEHGVGCKGGRCFNAREMRRWLEPNLCP